MSLHDLSLQVVNDCIFKYFIQAVRGKTAQDYAGKKAKNGGKSEETNFGVAVFVFITMLIIWGPSDLAS